MEDKKKIGTTAYNSANVPGPQAYTHGSETDPESPDQIGA